MKKVKVFLWMLILGLIALVVFQNRCASATRPTSCAASVSTRTNYAWLGTWNSREVYKVDPETCEIVAQLPTVNPVTGTNATSVYSLAIDPDGQLWTSSFTDDCIVRVDTREARVVEQLCYAPTRYGIAVGADGRVWYGGYGTTLVMYDPSTLTWSVIDGAPGLSETTGIVAANDGRVFVAGYNSNHVGRYDPSTGEWALFSTYKEKAQQH